MDQLTLEKELSGLPVGPIRFFERTGSTNDEAASWASAGAPHLAVVTADEQTAGRGRLNRRWLTPPGSALAISLILKELPTRGDLLSSHPLPFEETLTRITGLGALAVCQALEQGWKLKPAIKWPNDVLLQDRKVCGILCEAQWNGSHLESVILGIGVNVAANSEPPTNEVIFPATSVEGTLGQPVNRLEVLRLILAGVLDWLPLVAEPDFLKAWEKRLAYQGHWVKIYHQLGDRPGDLTNLAADQEGQVLGLDRDGALRLRDHQGQVFSIHHGELRLRPAGPIEH